MVAIWFWTFSFLAKIAATVFVFSFLKKLELFPLDRKCQVKRLLCTVITNYCYLFSFKVLFKKVNETLLMMTERFDRVIVCCNVTE